MKKIYKVVAAAPGTSPEEFSLAAALEKAAETGTLALPQEILCLEVAGGAPVVVVKK